jgi:hypothetical protein
MSDGPSEMSADSEDHKSCLPQLSVPTPQRGTWGILDSKHMLTETGHGGGHSEGMGGNEEGHEERLVALHKVPPFSGTQFSHFQGS